MSLCTTRDYWLHLGHDKYKSAAFELCPKRCLLRAVGFQGKLELYIDDMMCFLLTS